MLKIPIISTFNNTGIKQAQKQVGGLTTAFKKMGLASKLSLAAATVAVTRFARQSAAAAIAEEKAVRSLSVTLKNLGLAASDQRIGTFISKLQVATGVSEDQLRPAFQKLITVTGQVALSQELLNTALDVSAGTGKSVEQVVTALVRAYNGNNTALGRLGINLTKAQLKTMSFEQVTARLATTFRGQASEAAKTFGGQLAILGVAADEAKEKIGVSLINAIDDLAGNKGITGLADDMDRLATSTANVITGLAVLGGKLDFILKPLGALLGQKPFVISGLEDLGKRENELSKSGTPPKLSPLGEERKAIALGKQLAKINQDAAKAKAKELANQRALSQNKKLSAKFDQDNIAIEAALKGKLSDEDRARLLAMKALKSESLADDEAALKNLNDAQATAQQAELDRIKKAADARSAAIKQTENEHKALQNYLSANPLKQFITFTPVAGSAITAPADFGLPPSSNAAPTTNASITGAPLERSLGGFGGVDLAPTVNVTVNAGAVGNEQYLATLIGQYVTLNTRNGNVTAPAGFL
jgi:hypothetical protein